MAKKKKPAKKTIRPSVEITPEDNVDDDVEDRLSELENVISNVVSTFEAFKEEQDSLQELLNSVVTKIDTLPVRSTDEVPKLHTIDYQQTYSQVLNSVIHSMFNSTNLLQRLTKDPRQLMTLADQVVEVANIMHNSIVSHFNVE